MHTVSYTLVRLHISPGTTAIYWWYYKRSISDMRDFFSVHASREKFKSRCHIFQVHIKTNENISQRIAIGKSITNRVNIHAIATDPVTIHTLTTKTSNMSSSSTSSRIRFRDTVRVRTIPTHRNLTKTERKSMWYTSDDYQSFKNCYKRDAAIDKRVLFRRSSQQARVATTRGASFLCPCVVTRRTKKDQAISSASSAGEPQAASIIVDGGFTVRKLWNLDRDLRWVADAVTKTAEESISMYYPRRIHSFRRIKALSA